MKSQTAELLSLIKMTIILILSRLQVKKLQKMQAHWELFLESQEPERRLPQIR